MVKNKLIKSLFNRVNLLKYDIWQRKLKYFFVEKKSWKTSLTLTLQKRKLRLMG